MHNITNQTVNQRVKILRKVLKLSQKDFSRKIGYSQSYISKIESEPGFDPMDRFLNLIEQTFSVNPEWLRNGEGDMFLAVQKSGSESQYDEFLLPSDPPYISPDQDLSQFKHDDVVKIPVYKQSDLGAAVKASPLVKPIDWVPVKTSWITPHTFAIRVEENSVSPSIGEGDYVLVDTKLNKLKKTKIYAFEITHSESEQEVSRTATIIRRPYIERDRLVLKADDPFYEERVFPLEVLRSGEVKILGMLYLHIGLRFA